MHQRFYVGIMSGTSLDAIDAALISVSITSSKAEEYQLVNKASVTIPQPLKQTLLGLNQSGETAKELQVAKESEFELTQLYAKVYHLLIQSSSTLLKKEKIHAIGAHGQTIRHQPNDQSPYTLQLLNGALLSELCKADVVCDFRSRDIATGGQGAPFAPIFHQPLFSLSPTYAIVNLGGIANISIVSDHSITGFDCGPANCLMDSWIQKNQQKSFDHNGEWAKTGQLIPSLLKQLFDDDYMHLPAPKSTGRDYFSLSWLEKKLSGLEKKEDIMLTLLHFSAKAIANDIPNQTHSVCFVGGGAKNTLLIHTISHYLKSQKKQVKIVTSPIDPQFIEAAGFGYLGYLTHHKKTVNTSSITGSKRSHILGAIYFY